MELSIIVPAYNEEMHIEKTMTRLLDVLTRENLDFEIIVINDNCQDNTRLIVEELQQRTQGIKLINRQPPRGFGRAIREGINHARGKVIIPFMADLSDDPEDVIRYYDKIQEGYDCVFGSRFARQSRVVGYPPVKLVINRFVNRMLQLLFLTPHNDLTNSFKAFRSYVIESISPLQACHFNVTIEMSLSALIRKYKIAAIPINWNGRKWGQSNLRLSEMGRRYLATLLKIWFERLLVIDDLIEEKNKTLKKQP